ncbi:MAG: 2-hydroxyacid dehydrogenase [Candidatus Riflebacteria bacterium]|nr:2-hydroxyacid dehydrogenase [Candidatus Riflebacteria bacterium]
MNKKIAFFDAKPYDQKSFSGMNSDYGFDISYFDAKLTPQTSDLTIGFAGVCVFVNDNINAKVISRLVENGVEIIGLRCAGYNNVDFKAAYEKIHVTRVPAYSPHAVAEHAVAMMLTLNRKIHKAYLRTREGNFSLNGLLGFDMFGKTAGIIGTGRIARCLIAILKGFGMQILAYDPRPDEAYAESTGLRYVELDELYAISDIISLHCPLTTETSHLINRNAIEKMKPGIMIINTGRGKLIDTIALIEGLKSGRVGTAGLDVYEEESDYFFEDKSAAMITDDVLARLLTFPNVIVTSHQAFFTSEALRNIAQTTLSNFKEYFAGGYLANEICYRCDSNCIKQQGKRCF